MKTCDTAILHKLLNNYLLEEVGYISTNDQNEVFPARVNWADDLNISAPYVLLAAYHDGDPLFVLRPRKGSEHKDEH